ncbi:MAG: lysostaphin resistance A-like protein [Planctomycetaceae bacterium]
MQSAIGRHFTTSPQHRRIALGWVAVVIVADLLIDVLGLSASTRLAAALLVVAVFVALSDGDLISLGFRSRPKQGWIPWIRISAAIGVIVGVFVFAGLGIWHLWGHEIKIRSIDPARSFPTIVYMCFTVPILEEAIYRLLLCGSLASTVGNWPTIAISGGVFGGLHVIYGNASPENLVGGFFLAWAFLKSETILLPLLLHSLGNFIVFCAQILGWYYLQQAG